MVCLLLSGVLVWTAPICTLLQDTCLNLKVRILDILDISFQYSQVLIRAHQKKGCVEEVDVS